MGCRTGCPTKDCGSYAECCRASGVRVAYAQSAKGLDFSSAKRLSNELAEYRQLKSEGVQPQGTSRWALDRAKAISDVAGKPYNAER